MLYVSIECMSTLCNDDCNRLFMEVIQTINDEINTNYNVTVNNNNTITITTNNNNNNNITTGTA